MMGYFKNMYDDAYNQVICGIEETAEMYYEDIRDENFEYYLRQGKKEVESYTQNEKESMRIDCQRELEELSEEISAAWNASARKVAIFTIFYTYAKYIVFLPVVVFLLMDQVILSQISAIAALALYLILCLDSVYYFMIYYFSGIYEEYELLDYLYQYYGVSEATIKIVDTRGLSRLNRGYKVYSCSQKLPN